MGTSKKDREVIKQLINMLSNWIDYASCMQLVTRYKTSNDPNVLKDCRYLDKVKKEYELGRYSKKCVE